MEKAVQMSLKVGAKRISNRAKVFGYIWSKLCLQSRQSLHSGFKQELETYIQALAYS